MIPRRGLLGHLNWYESYLIARYEASAAFVPRQRRRTQEVRESCPQFADTQALVCDHSVSLRTPQGDILCGISVASES